MKTSRIVFAFWGGVIALLAFVEVAEVTRLFRIPIQSALANPLLFVSSLVFTTVLALVGAVFIGIYISHRLRSPGGFTPFEEEMLRMRSEIASLREKVDELHGLLGGSARSAPRSEAEPVDRRGGS